MTSGIKKELFFTNPNYIYREIGDKHVLVAIGKEIADFRGYIHLNESAAFLWKELQNGRTRNQLIDLFLNKYEISVSQAEKDIDKCLNVLLSKGLIHK